MPVREWRKRTNTRLINTVKVVGNTNQKHPEIPSLTTEQMIEVDRAMMEDYKIELIQMMENAGRNLAHLARQRFFEGDPKNKRVFVLAGTGGNGGGALVCARRLHNWGAHVSVTLTKPKESFKVVPAHQLEILERMNLPLFQFDQIVDQNEEIHLIIDGVIGYSLKGDPRAGAARLIEWANKNGSPILSLDAPSGVDTTSGKVFRPAIKAMATMTLALPKKGLFAKGVETHVGELYLADISVPPELYLGKRFNLKLGPIFSNEDIVRIR